MASGPGSSMQKLSAPRNLGSSSHFSSSTRTRCMSAICAAGPPKDSIPMRQNTANIRRQATPDSQCASSPAGSATPIITFFL